MSQPTLLQPRRGDVFLVNFDLTLGVEIKKIRPALIIQNDIANRHSPITIVAAISTQFSEGLYPTEVLVTRGEGGLDTESVIVLNQLRSVDKARLIKRLGKVSEPTLQAADRALAISLGLR